MHKATDQRFSWRYTDIPFPPYPFVPGETPHPRRHRHGHSFGLPEPKPKPFAPTEWHTSQEYLLGVDLFNFGYWWESHEQFEALWHAFGHQTPEGAFFKGLIQLSAAGLKRRMQNPSAVSRLLRNARMLLEQIPSPYMGLDIERLTKDISRVDVVDGGTLLQLCLESSGRNVTINPIQWGSP